MGLRAAAPLLLVAIAVSGCGPHLVTTGHGGIEAVGAESQYADVITQTGGRYVTVMAVMNNPSIDPHAFESSPTVANAITAARLVVQNGLGYDDFMSRIEAAAPSPQRTVIDAQRLLELPAGAANPHLWYRPATMPAVAAAVASALTRIAPRHAAYFRTNARRFDRSLRPWYRELARLRHRFAGVAVATTEPVANYLLHAAGLRIRTPPDLQLDVMNGLDPAPQDISLQDRLLSKGLVRAFVYNRQVTDSTTQSFLGLARAHHVPVVGVYETMPAGLDYQQWMLEETQTLARALRLGIRTETR